MKSLTARPLHPRAEAYAVAWRGWVRRNRQRFERGGWLEVQA
jgi:hypothetical protein